MAELPFEIRRRTTVVSHTGDTINTVVDADTGTMTIAAADFTPGREYLLLVMGGLGGSSTAFRFRARLNHGGSAFGETVFQPEPNGAGTTNVYSYLGLVAWTAVASEDITLTFRTPDSGQTVHFDDVVLVAIELSELLTSGTDYFYDSDTTDASLVAGVWSTTGNASVTFTPGTAGHDWLVIGVSRIQPGDTTSDLQVRLNLDSGSDLNPVASQQSENTGERKSMSVIRVYNLDATEHTIEVETQNQDASNGTRDENVLFVLNLNRFVNHTSFYNQAEIDPVETPEYGTQIGTVTMTPDVSGNVFCLGYFIDDIGQAPTPAENFRLQLDNTSDWAPKTNSKNYNVSWSSQDQHPIQMFDIQSIDDTEHTVDLDADANSMNTRHQDRVMAMFTLEVVPSITSTFVQTIPGIFESPIFG